jgi:hypothetical protein
MIDTFSFVNLQAWPMLRDKKRFMRLADPLLGRRYPVKGLYQALAVASMCLQEDAASRPTRHTILRRARAPSRGVRQERVDPRR